MKTTKSKRLASKDMSERPIRKLAGLFKGRRKKALSIAEMDVAIAQYVSARFKESVSK